MEKTISTETIRINIAGIVRGCLIAMHHGFKNRAAGTKHEGLGALDFAFQCGLITKDEYKDGRECLETAYTAKQMANTMGIDTEKYDDAAITACRNFERHFKTV